MTNRRAKIAAGATVVALGALGGAALGTNPGMPAGTQPVASNGSSAIVTGASGAAALPATQNAALHQVRPPIITRASGAGAGANLTEED